MTLAHAYVESKLVKMEVIQPANRWYRVVSPDIYNLLRNFLLF